MTRQRAFESMRSLRMAAWLGWQIESNWAAPFLFTVYSIAKPIAGALILVLMYTVIARGGLQNPLFPQIFVGSAFYIYVAMVLMGVSQAVVEDREHYGMLKYMYVAPLNVHAYLLGRGVAQAIVATMAVLITLLFGIVALGDSDGAREHRLGNAVRCVAVWVGGRGFRGHLSRGDIADYRAA
jgi:ABC-2 type transport system permease protein